MSRRHARTLAGALGAALVLAAVPANAAGAEYDYTILNPYASVDWSWEQYKSALHNHSYESDGSGTPAERLEYAYSLGFDVFALTDHNTLNTAWDRTDRPAFNGDNEPLTYLTSERKAEIEAGVDRDGRGMLEIPFSNEQSRSDHLNTFWVDFNNASGATLESNIAMAHELGGISHINHPGRYTGGAGQTGAEGVLASSNPETVAYYAGLFERYQGSLVGMEIVNKKDGDSASDRILWDNILVQTMPEVPVWGFSNDDAHSNSAQGFSYNMHLMPENTEEAFRTSMEQGTFYATALVAKRELGATFVAEGPAPTITNIVVDETADSITIEAENTREIQWIADGRIVATGATIDLDEVEGVYTYVRANLLGAGGISFTQPFGVTGGAERPAIDIASIALGIDRDSITPGEQAQLTLEAWDSAGSPVDLGDMIVAFSADTPGVLDISADGVVTVANPPLANMRIGITADVVAGTTHLASNGVALTVDVGNTDTYIALPIRTGNDDVEQYMYDGHMYFDSSDLEIVDESPNFETDASGDPQVIGLRFDGVTIPKGATIDAATVRFTTDEVKNGDPFAVTIAGEAADASAAFTTQAFDISSRVLTTATVEWKDIPAWETIGESGPAQTTPDLAAIVQEIVARYGWAEGNALTIVMRGQGARTAEAADSGAATAPVLEVAYTVDGAQTVAAFPVLTGADDAEEMVADGGVNLTSSDLEIIDETPVAAEAVDGGVQTIGLRFDGLNIPAGAVISEAYIQFTVDEYDKSTPLFNTVIAVEDVDHSAPFANVAFDVTNRAFAERTVAWVDAPLWTANGDAGEGERTPDLAELIQQVVSREGWAEGNALTFAISGEGTRVAEARESGLQTAPTLHVLYTMPEEPMGDPDGEEGYNVPFEVKTNNGRFLSDSEAGVAALAEVNRMTALVTDVTRDFGRRDKQFVVTVETATKVYTIRVHAETGAILSSVYVEK